MPNKNKKPQRPSKKRVRYPIHKNGKYCGYDEYEDGSIRIARTHSADMDESMQQEKALIALAEVFAQQCQKIMVSIQKTREHFWERVADDYGLDLNQFHYFYQSDTKMITRKNKQQPEIQKDEAP
jgi:hypothetical protein